VTPVKGEPSRLANVEVLIDEDHARDTLNTLQIVKRVKCVECL